MERTIRSRSHPLVRRVTGLLRDAGRREEERCFVVEGRRLASEALGSSLHVELALIASDLLRDDTARPLCEAILDRGIECRSLSGGALRAAQDADAPQGVALVVRMPEADLDRVANSDGDRLVVVAWHVQDPGNLGAIIRAAEAAGASGVVTTRGGADPFHPRAVRGSAGSILRVPVARESDPSSLPSRLRSRGLSIAAAVPRGGTRYDRADLAGPLALLVGSEGSGLPPELERSVDLRVTIPMMGRVESLNVAVSTALLLFEARRQRL